MYKRSTRRFERETLMRRKQRHGGLSPHYVRLIRGYLRTLNDPNAPQATMTAALFAWIDIVMGGADAMVASRLQAAPTRPNGSSFFFAFSRVSGVPWLPKDC